ncbi:hypothetical protein DLAC_02181 [Tieghemostelium lacteum]|uniref:inosine/xanthosine triphosphatase n=1 Tax=Tieghemostelium lacteum TaxID=361077 RepID=A0A152A4E4_TIELA|nr:hypothetical protein DLAC_02181 [Tieghemostelium lacteum]|eukprot:KYR01084.1 hypothetical protein DLAC_02181 [Tieghemostelium lacteum]
MISIAIGSENQAKIRAVELAIKSIWPDKYTEFKLIPCKVSSKVSDQPLSDEETIQGAINRAKASLELHSDATYAIGLEGGIHHIEFIDKYFELVVDRKGSIGIASTDRFELPKSVMHEILVNKKELAQVMDELTGKSEIRSKEGAMGVFTNGLLHRDLIYSNALIFAFSRFITNYFDN